MAARKELSQYPETAKWSIKEVDEISLDQVKKAFKDKGMYANFEEDATGGMSPFGFLSYL